MSSADSYTSLKRYHSDFHRATAEEGADDHRFAAPSLNCCLAAKRDFQPMHLNAWLDSGADSRWGFLIGFCPERPFY